MFQKLIASKSQDQEGFRLLKTMIAQFPMLVNILIFYIYKYLISLKKMKQLFFRQLLQPQMKNIFVLLFQRLSSTKTTKFVRELIVFISFCVIKYGATFTIDIIDSIQNGFVLQFCKNIYNKYIKLLVKYK